MDGLYVLVVSDDPLARTGILGKLGARSRGEAIVQAVRLGLVVL